MTGMERHHEMLKLKALLQLDNYHTHKTTHAQNQWIVGPCSLMINVSSSAQNKVIITNPLCFDSFKADVCWEEVMLMASDLDILS